MSLQGPQSSDFLFGSPRFQERYRSNSMDSILVADMNRHLYAPPGRPRDDPAAMNLHNLHHFAPVMMPGGPVTNGSLEKRPTFDNIDKRASWSLDKSQSSVSLTSPHQLQRQPDRNYSIYSNSGRVAVPPTAPQKRMDLVAGPKKPIPLPRSKIPVPSAVGQPVVDNRGDRSRPPSVEFRTFKRSKTDLSLDALSAYKAGRAIQGGAVPGRVVQGQKVVIPTLSPHVEYLLICLKFG